MWFRKSKTERPQEEKQEFAWCEPGMAAPMGKQHLRRLPEGELKLSGFGEATALCGRDLRYGWDLPSSTDADTVRSLSTPREGDGHVWACLACVNESGILK